MGPTASASTGSTSDCNHRPGDSPNGTYPTAGNHPNLTAKSEIKTAASQNDGSASPSSENASTMRPIVPPRTALNRPKPTPTSTLTISAPTNSDNVTGNRLVMACVPGSPETIDTPRSPCKARVSHRQYCSYNGRSSPRLSRNRAYSSGVALKPRISRAGSPGVSDASTNVSAETKNSNGTANKLRRVTTRTAR